MDEVEAALVLKKNFNSIFTLEELENNSWVQPSKLNISQW